MNRIYVLILALFSMHYPLLDAKTVAVFCSGDDKVSNEYREPAKLLGQELGIRHFGLVTGGSKTGLMKEVVDGYVSTAVSLGQLHGVLPKVLEKFNVHHDAILWNQIDWVDSFYDRLARFHELADVIIVLPGGFGTVHELMDFLVHNQFGLDNQLIVLVNINGFWTHLIEQFKYMKEQQLLACKHLDSLIVVNSIVECIDSISSSNKTNSQQGLDDRYWETR